MKMTLERNGSFMVNDKAEDHAQCGFRRGDRQVFFEVVIESDSACLDENGFILDNNEVQHYFDRTYSDVEVFQSCESIAIRAIDDLREIMGYDRVFSIRCTIKPGTHAGITAEKCFQCRIDSNPGGQS